VTMCEVQVDSRIRAQHLTETFEQLVERHAPGFRQLIIADSVQLPANLEAVGPSLRAGAINGLAPPSFTSS
jgi:hypothetical protein